MGDVLGKDLSGTWCHCAVAFFPRDGSKGWRTEGLFGREQVDIGVVGVAAVVVVVVDELAIACGRDVPALLYADTGRREILDGKTVDGGSGGGGGDSDGGGGGGDSDMEVVEGLE